MTSRSRARTLAILAALLAWAGTAAAQEPVALQVVTATGPEPGIGVFVLVEGEPWEIGETDAGGRIPAPSDLVGLEFGDLVAVREIACRERRSIVLVPPGAPGDAACATVGPDCECLPLGAFLWGDAVRIDLSERAVAAAPGARPAPRAEADRPDPREADRPPREPEPRPEPRRPMDAPPARGPAWTAAVGGGYAAWPNLDLACGSTGLASSSCDLASDGPVVRAAVEFRPWPDRPFGIAVDGSFAPGLEVDQTFPPSVSDAGGPSRNVVETDVWTVGGFGVGRLGVGESVDAFVGVGYVWAVARADATTTFGGGLETTDDRQDSGGRVAGRAGLEWSRPGSPVGVRVEAGGMTGEEDDLLAGWHVGAMLLVPLGDR